MRHRKYTYKVCKAYEVFTTLQKAYCTSGEAARNEESLCRELEREMLELLGKQWAARLLIRLQGCLDPNDISASIFMVDHEVFCNHLADSAPAVTFRRPVAAE